MKIEHEVLTSDGVVIEDNYILYTERSPAGAFTHKTKEVIFTPEQFTELKNLIVNYQNK